MIADQIREYLLEKVPERKITDLRMGLIYAGVVLDNGKAGVAYTFRENFSEGCDLFEGMRPLTGRSTHELLHFIGSPNVAEASLGFAVANALVNQETEAGQGGDALDSIELKKEDRVGMVGFFGPMVPLVKEKVRELLIFELQRRGSEHVLPAEQALAELPGCDIALITSTSLINGTSDTLLEAAAKHCREIVLLGPSTPLIPKIFKPRGVTLLSGAIITDPPGILQVISEGGGMRFFKDYIKKVNVRV